MSLHSEHFADCGLQATMLGLSNSSGQLGNLIATLVWSLVVETTGLRGAFGVASVMFTCAALPLLPSAASAAALCLRKRGYRRGCCFSSSKLLLSHSVSDMPVQPELSCT